MMKSMSRQRYTTPEMHGSTTAMKNGRRGRIRLSWQRKRSQACHGRKTWRDRNMVCLIFFNIGAACAEHAPFFLLNRSWAQEVGPIWCVTTDLVWGGAKAQRSGMRFEALDPRPTLCSCERPGTARRARPDSLHGRATAPPGRAKRLPFASSF
jgi:hypothetical protein